jgi:formate hydrogenlyase subunit 6/NADH:ubiquinone oxidoreductase subunit I
MMKLGIMTEMIRNMVRRPITVRFPRESKPVSENYRGEHVYHTDKCAGCGLCARVCPNRAIEMVDVEEEGKTVKRPKIDMSKCCFCGLCQDACLTGAIRLGSKIPDSVYDPSSLIKRPANIKEVKK